MRGHARSLSLLVIVILSFTVLSSARIWAQTLEEKVKKFTLENGMTFLVVERHEAPVAFCAIGFNVGSANEWPNVTGISHFLEHMVFKGTKMMGTTNYEAELPYLQKIDELGEKTIELRKKIGEWRFEIFKDFSKQVVNDFTPGEREHVGTEKSKENALLVEKIRAMKELPDSLTSKPYLIKDGGTNFMELYLEHESAWGEVAQLLEEERQYIKKEELWGTYMNNGARFLNAGTSEDNTVYFSYLPANRVELWMTMESDRMETPIFREFWPERDVVMEERRLGENDPDDVLYETFMSVAFTASPYNWPVVGWMSDLLTIDPKELEGYFRTHYAPNNAVAMVVGDVDFNSVQKMTARYFGPIPSQPEPPVVETREPEQKGERRFTVEHTANPKLMIGYHKPTYPHPDAYVFDVLEDVLTSGRTSRFYKLIYEEQELTADPPAAYSGPGQRYDNLFIIEAEPRHPHTLEEVEKAFYVELERLKTEPVSERELQRVKNQIDANLIRNLGSNVGIAFRIGMGELFYGDYREMFRAIEKIKAVTAGDITRVAKQYFREQNRTVGYRVKIAEEGEAEGEIDRQALMQYIQSLSSDQQMEIMKKFQTMRSDAERKAFARELWEKRNAESAKGK